MWKKLSQIMEWRHEKLPPPYPKSTVRASCSFHFFFVWTVQLQQILNRLKSQSQEITDAKLNCPPFLLDTAQCHASNFPNVQHQGYHEH